jgi:hypothetical protein
VTGFSNAVISTNCCERNHGYVKSRIRPMRGLKNFDAPHACSQPSKRCSWSSVTSCGTVEPPEWGGGGRAPLCDPQAAAPRARLTRAGDRPHHVQPNR